MKLLFSDKLPAMRLNIDSGVIDIQCPECEFWNSMTLREARLGIVSICRGCKVSIVPTNSMGEVETARRRITQAVDDLAKAFGGG